MRRNVGFLLLKMAKIGFFQSRLSEFDNSDSDFSADFQRTNRFVNACTRLTPLAFGTAVRFRKMRDCCANKLREHCDICGADDLVSHFLVVETQDEATSILLIVDDLICQETAHEPLNFGNQEAL